jgi:hypothetical protein
MPTGKYAQNPHGTRPADVISNAVAVMRIATGEIEESGVLIEAEKKARLERLGASVRETSV